MVTELTVCRCWVRSTMLPTGMSTEHNATYGRMTNVSKEEKVMSPVEMFGKIHLDIDLRDPLYAHHMEGISYTDAKRWSSVEANV